jgi:hypothetical protein
MVAADLNADLLGTWTKVQTIIPETNSGKRTSFIKKEMANLVALLFNKAIEYCCNEAEDILKQKNISGDEKSLKEWTEFSKNLVIIIDEFEKMGGTDYLIDIDQVITCNKLVNRIIGRMKKDYFKNTESKNSDEDNALLGKIAQSDYSFLINAL